MLSLISRSLVSNPIPYACCAELAHPDSRTDFPLSPTRRAA
jgi:hypothetical protein